MAINKEDKEYTRSEKHLFISLNDYSLFEATDSEMIGNAFKENKKRKQIENIRYSSYILKNKAIKKRGQSGE